MQLVGWEGIWASLMWIVALTAFQFISCSDDTFCSNNRLEDTYGAWMDYASNPQLIWQSLAIFLIIPLSSFCGVSTTKRGSATQRITIILARNAVVWIFFSSVPMHYDAKGRPLYDEEFTFMQLSGFFLLALGILIFNEIIVLPFCKLNKYTK